MANELEGKDLGLLPAGENGRQRSYPAGGSLQFRVSKTQRSWYLSVRKPGARNSSRVLLGRWPTMGIRQARRAAEAMKVKLREQPRAKVGGSHDAANVTFGEAALEFVERPRGRRQLRPTTKTDYLGWLRREPMMSWLNVPVPQLSKGRIVAGLQTINGAVSARAQRMFVAAVLAHVEATRDGYQAPRLPPVGAPAERRRRVLTDDELAVLWAATGLLEQRDMVLLRLLILCGTRVAETALASWEFIDLEAATWTIPAEISKSHRALTVQLCPTAVAMLRQYPRWTACPWVFTANRRDPPSMESAVRTAMIRARALGAGEGYRPHDIRRTMRTRMAQLGVAADIAERCLNHARDPLEDTYDRHEPVEEMRAAWGAWERYILRLAAEHAERAAKLLGTSRAVVLL